MAKNQILKFQSSSMVELLSHLKLISQFQNEQTLALI